MAYFKINNTDYSKYVSGLIINKEANYNSQTNAAGNTVVDYINTKRTIEVTIIPINDAAMKTLQTDINKFNVTLSFMNPDTNQMENNVNCIIPSSGVEYYTIQSNRVLFKAFNLEFIEL